MELLQLTYFCDAAESENFSKTAAKYNVPPSGVSQSIKRLEYELSVKLFVRRSNKITLSDEGRAFYKGAKAALNSLSDAKRRLKDFGSTPSGEIRIALRTHRRTVTEAIESFKKKYPEVSFVLTHERNTGDYDLIITSQENGYPGYERQLLLEEQLLLAMSEGEEYRGNKLPNYNDCRFVTMGSGSDFYDATVDACHKAGFFPDIAIQTDDPYYVRKYVEMGLGVTLVPSVSWRGLFSDKARIVEVGSIFRKVFLYTKDESIMSRACRLFLPYLEETFEREAKNPQKPLNKA